MITKNYPKVFELGIVNSLGLLEYPTSGMILELKGQTSRWQGHKVQNILKAIEYDEYAHLVTHADGNRVSIAIILVCESVCDSVRDSVCLTTQ